MPNSLYSRVNVSNVTQIQVLYNCQNWKMYLSQMENLFVCYNSLYSLYGRVNVSNVTRIQVLYNWAFFGQVSQSATIDWSVVRVEQL